MTPLNRVLESLRERELDPRECSPGQWESRCPAHVGTRRNLSVSEGADQRGLIKCQKGCGVGQVVSALGLAESDLFARHTNGKSKSAYKQNVSLEQQSADAAPSKTNSVKPAPIEIADQGTLGAVYNALIELLSLDPAHKADLAARGLDEPHIVSGRYRTLPKGGRHGIAAKIQKKTGLSVEQLIRVPGFGREASGRLKLYGASGLLIPVTGLQGDIIGAKIRSDQPSEAIPRYTWISSGKHGGAQAPSSPHVPNGSDMVAETVRLTEGPIKAHVAAVKSGMLTIGVPGVGTWNRAIPIFREIGAKTIRLAFDADWTTNANVAKSFAEATRGIVGNGFQFEVEKWSVESGKGIDDVLVAGGAIELLIGLDAIRFALDASRGHDVKVPVCPEHVIAWANWYLSRDLDIFSDRELLSASRDLCKLNPTEYAKLDRLLKQHNISMRNFERATKHEYQATNKSRVATAKFKESGNQTYICYTNGDGEVVDELIANFTARITKEIERHEGTERRLRFVIEARHRSGIRVTATVDAEKYAKMDWVESLGSIFTVTSGRGTRDQLREAIQTLSQQEGVVPRIEVFTSLGWQETAHGLVYLHAGGAIGPDGPVDVNVEPPSVLNKYLLPTPTIDAEILAKCIESCVDVLSLGKANRQGARGMAATIAASPFRAVLGGANPNTIHYSGGHHARKTTVAKLSQHFFCYLADDATMISATWESSAKSLQRFAFDARDTLLVIDELTGERAIEVATEIIQAQGNLRAGMRLTQSREFAQTFDPRGSITSTGEADPPRQSTLGRTLIVRFDKTTVDLTTLSRLQGHASKGHFAIANSAFIQWLANPGRLEAMRLEFRRLADEIIAQHKTDVTHMRHLGAVAELAAAYRIFMRFAVEKGALAEITAKSSSDTVERYLIELYKEQNQSQQEADPAERFLNLFRAGMMSGRFHLRGSEQSDFAPEPYAGACGWKRDWLYDGAAGQRLEWQVPANSKQVGYIDTDQGCVLLDPDLAKTVAQTVSREQGRAFENPDKIERDLASAGVSKTVSMGGKTRLTIQHTVRGYRQRFIEIPVYKVFDVEAALENAPPAPP
jgi:hypothetical protein